MSIEVYLEGKFNIGNANLINQLIFGDNLQKVKEIYKQKDHKISLDFIKDANLELQKSN